MARSVFYYHRKRLKTKEKYAKERKEVKSIFYEHKGRYGYRRITAEMRNRNYTINHKTVQRIMIEMGLKCQIRKVRYRSYKGEVGKTAPNIIERGLRNHCSQSQVGNRCDSDQYRLNKALFISNT